MKLETGKLDSELLKKIVFGKITYRSDDVSVRPGDRGRLCGHGFWGSRLYHVDGPYFIGGKRYRPFGDPYHVQRYCFQRCSAAGDHAGCNASGGDDG